MAHIGFEIIQGNADKAKDFKRMDCEGWGGIEKMKKK
jgi:hypothetical protein